MKSKKLNRWELFTTNIGTVVGSGVVTATGLAVAQTGNSAWIAYGLAVIIGFLLAIPTIFGSSVMIVDGGTYTTNRLYCGPLVAGAASIAGVLNFFGNGMMSLALGSYINSLIPAVNYRIVAAIMLTLLFVLNFKGVKTMAKVQAILSPIMFCGLGIFIIFGLFNLSSNPFAFTKPGFFLNGADGLMTGCMLLCFSTQGTVTALFYNRQSENPKKDVPWAILMTTLGIFILYVLVALVDGNVLPVDQVAGKPLTDVAYATMPRVLAVLFVVFGPIMCLITTVNGGWASFYRPIAAASKEGLLPAVIGKETKEGIPWIVLCCQYVAGMFPIVSGLSIGSIMNSLVLATSLLGIVGRIGAFRMPTLFPEQWKKSHLHVPDAVYYLCCTLALIANLFLTWRSIKSLQLGLVIFNFAVIIVCFIWCYFRMKTGKVSSRSITYTFYDHWEDDPQFQEAADAK